MAMNNVFSTWLNTWFNNGFGVGSGNWMSGGVSTPAKTPEVKTPTKQEKFPWLNSQQIANIEKYTANLTWAEKKQVQQQLYQAVIQQIEKQKYDDNRTAAENERRKNSLTKTDPRECKFDQSACRQSVLVDMVKEARNLKPTTSEETVMSMFMQEMDYRWIGMDKLNSYLENWDETILYQAWLKSNKWGTRDLVNQASTSNKSWDEKNLYEKWETITNYTNLYWLATEEIDNRASNVADNWLNFGTMWTEYATENLKNRIESLTDDELTALRNQYNNMISSLDEDDDYTIGEGISDIFTALRHGTAWRLFGTEDKAYEAAARLTQSSKKEWGWFKIDKEARMNNESFKRWLIDNQATFLENMAWANDILKWENNPNVVQLFWNIPASTLKTFTATVRWMTNPYDTIKWMVLLGKDVYDNWFKDSIIWQRYWSWDAFAKAMNEDPVWVADDALAVAELWTNIVRWWLNAAWKVTGNQSLVTAGSKIPKIWSANDVLADRFVHGWQIRLPSWVKDVNGVFWTLDKITWGKSTTLWKINNALQIETDAWRLANTIANTTKDAIKAWAEYVKNSKVGKGVSNFADELINKVVWIDKEDRQFIRENKDLVNDHVSKKKSVDTVFDEVKEKLSDKALEKIETGKEYWELTKNKKKIVKTDWLTQDKQIKKTFKKHGISVDANWDLVFDKINEFDAKQQKALQDAWQVLKDMEWEKKLNTQQTLSQRKKIDNKVNWEWKPEKLSSADKDVESLIREMRKTIDNRAKRDIPWLKELDAKYQPLIEEVKQMRKDWYDSDWNLKDNARSKIRNLTKAWNEEKLARLEKIAPWITKELKALDVALTIDKVTKMTVWQYTKGAAFWWAAVSQLFSGNLVGALGIAAVWVLATPKNFVWLLTNFPELWNKIVSWAELSPAEISRLQAIASRLEDWENFWK